MPFSYHHDDGGGGGYNRSSSGSYHSSRNSMGQDRGGGGGGGGLYQILCVSNISSKYPDSTVRNELMKEFSRFGEPSVKLVYDKNTRLAYIYFNNYDDAREARYAKSRLILLDKQIVLDPIYERMSSSSSSGGVPSSRKRSLTPEYPPMRGGGGGFRHLSPPPPMSSSSRRAPPPPPPPSSNRSSSFNHDRYQLHPRDSYREHSGHYQSGGGGGSHHYSGNHHHQLSSRSSGGEHGSYHLHSGGSSAGNYSLRNSSGSGGGGSSHHSHHHSQPSLSSSSGNHNNSSQLSSSSSPGSAGQGGQSQLTQQQRESKKEKFPNYLHHIPPEEDDKATRTLFVGNLETTIAEPDLRRIFERYGVVEDVDVKRPPPGQGNAYAFIKFLNLDMAHRAKVEMSGQYIGKFQCKIGYGKATPTTRIWVGGLGAWTSYSQLDKEFDRFGAIRKIDYVKNDGHAYIQYDTIDAAQAACSAMRGFPLGGADKRLRVDYADVAVAAVSTTAGSAAGASPSRVEGGGSPTSAGGAAAAAANNNNNGSGNDNGEFWRGEGGERWTKGYPGSPKRRRTEAPNSQLEEGEEPPETANGSSAAADLGGGGGSSSPNSQLDKLLLSNGKMEVTISEGVSSIAELIKCCPDVWLGGLALKTSACSTRLYFCHGDASLLARLRESAAGALGPDCSPLLRITQRLRMEPSKLEDVSRRLSAINHPSSSSSSSTAGPPTGFCIMIATQAAYPLSLQPGGVGNGAVGGNNGNNAAANGGGGGEGGDGNENGGGGGEDNAGTGAGAAAAATSTAFQQRPIRNLVAYLKSKEAAGVVLLKPPPPETVTAEGESNGGGGGGGGKDQPSCTLYFFPPHFFSVEALQKIAPRLKDDWATKEDYLVAVLTRDNSSSSSNNN